MVNKNLEHNDLALQRLWDELAATEVGTAKYELIMKEIVALSATRTAIAKEHVEEEKWHVQHLEDVRKFEYEKERDKKERRRGWWAIFAPIMAYLGVYGFSTLVDKFGDRIEPKIAQTVRKDIRPK